MTKKRMLLPDDDVLDDMVRHHGSTEDIDYYHKVCMKAALQAPSFQEWLRGMRNAVREEAAKVCEAVPHADNHTQGCLNFCAAAIRSLKEQS